MNRAQQNSSQFTILSSLYGERLILKQGQIKRIAIIRSLPGLGDMLCTVPAFRALRGAFPQAEIVLIGLKVIKPLIQRFSHYIDKLLEFPGYPGLPEIELKLAEIPIFLQMMQQSNFDLALQMHGSGTITNPLTALLGAKHSAGFFIPGQYCPSEKSFLPYLPHESEVRRYLRLLQFLGVPDRGEHLEFNILEKDEKDLYAIEEWQHISTQEYVCVHPGASTPSRCWDPEGFAIVADALAKQGLQIVLTGSKSEIELTQKVASLMKYPSINLAGKTSLGALATLLKNCRLLVSNDTGVSHLSAALQVKSVVIFTFSDPERWAPLDRDRHRIVCQNLNVVPEPVITQAKSLLEQKDVYVA